MCADTTKCVNVRISLLEKESSTTLLSALIAERGTVFRDDENVATPRKFFQKYFQNFCQPNIKKRRCDASNDWFCNSVTYR